MDTRQRRAVFLDRDGVLNRLVSRNGKRVSPRRVSHFHLFPGIGAVVNELRQAGLLAVVVTNQPDVARGFMTAAELERMHDRLRAAATLDAIYACVHDDRHQCACRKPKPGLVLDAARELGINVPQSFLVGDSWKDIEAGKAAGCRTILVESDSHRYDGPEPDARVADLAAAAKWILNHL